MIRLGFRGAVSGDEVFVGANPAAGAYGAGSFFALGDADGDGEELAAGSDPLDSGSTPGGTPAVPIGPIAPLLKGAGLLVSGRRALARATASRRLLRG